MERRKVRCRTRKKNLEKEGEEESGHRDSNVKGRGRKAGKRIGMGIASNTSQRPANRMLSGFRAVWLTRAEQGSGGS